MVEFTGLEISQLESGYGETKILHGVDLHVKTGRVHALLGRNGVGKSTTLKTIAGQLPAMAGNISLDGQSLLSRKPYEIARLGLAYVPETRDIFGALTVKENLEVAARLAGNSTAWSLEKILDMFPNLAQRMNNGGHELSGGEQQMLAIGRALISNPAILLLDEPTEGLAPIIIQQIFSTLQVLKEEGMTILLVEQNINFATGLADEISLLGRGKIVWQGSAESLLADEKAHENWLGV